MNRLLFFLISLMFYMGGYSAADWHNTANNLLDGQRYRTMADELKPIYDKSNDNKERYVLAGLIAYACRNLDQSDLEKYWIIKFFNYDSIDYSSYNFLNSSHKLKITDFLNKWALDFPVIKIISDKLTYTKENLFNYKIVFHSSITAIVKIVHGNNSIFSGEFRTGNNEVNLSLSLKDVLSNIINLNSVISSPVINYQKSIVCKFAVNFPDDIIINNDHLALRGSDFRPEMIDSEIIIIKKYFDKKHFLNKSLLPIVFGTVILTGNQLILKRKLDNHEYNSDSGPWLKAGSGSAYFVSGGLIGKGLIHFVRSFKKDRFKRTDKIKNDMATDWNQAINNKIADILNSPETIITSIKLIDKE